MKKNQILDVAVIGGGVTGAAIFYLLKHYTNVESLMLFEKREKLGQVSSAMRSNSQTLHFGDIETNYSLEKAKVVKRGAEMVANYLDRLKDQREVYEKFPKMVLAVGKKEIEILEKRHEEFKNLFPKLQILRNEDIQKIEPKILEGRNPSIPLMALYTEDGYAVNYARLAETFIFDEKESVSNNEIRLNTDILSVKKDGDVYLIQTNHEEIIQARVVIFATAGHALLAAKELGYADELMILPVVGNFFHTPKVLNGKVYTLQRKGLPFAAVHGDPDLSSPDKTRFGPTAKVLPILEHGNWLSAKYFFKMFDLRLDSLASVFNILIQPIYLKFTIENFLYDIPILGTRVFLRNIRKIIPSMTWKDVKRARGFGGIRPQIVNRKTKKVSLGEAKLIGDNIIFNITPSPGASTCLANAEADVKKVIEFFDGEFAFEEKKFEENFIS